jgi:TRAP-type C4-dicarboxylate transport system permease small subunit
MIMNAINDIVKKISAKADVLAAVCIFAVMLLVISGIIMRRIVGQPIMGAYELVGLLTAAGIALAQANCTIKNGHVALTLFIDRLSGKKQQIVDASVNAIMLVFWITIAWRLFVYGLSTLSSGMVSSTAQIPIYPFIFVLAAGVFCLCLVLAVRLAQSVGAVRKAGK